MVAVWHRAYEMEGYHIVILTWHVYMICMTRTDILPAYLQPRSANICSADAFYIHGISFVFMLVIVHLHTQRAVAYIHQTSMRYKDTSSTSHSVPPSLL
jgi:hypothetical protein